MPKVKIIFNREGCIGAGVCWSLCPQHWQRGEDGKANLLNSKKNPQTGELELEIETDQKDLKAIKEAAAGCPVQVIKVEEN